MRSLRTPAVLVTPLILTPVLFAVITAELPLRKIISEDSQYIVAAKVQALDRTNLQMVLTVEEQLKGKLPFAKLPVVLKGDKEAEKLGHVPQLLKRLGNDLRLLLFIQATDKKMTALAYTNGTWMQLVGDKTGPETSVWSLTHGEPYLRRTYKGPTDDLKKLVAGFLVGKKRAPDIDKNAEPGFGPEFSSK